jgi:hypothetical protein
MEHPPDQDVHLGERMILEGFSKGQRREPSNTLRTELFDDLCCLHDSNGSARSSTVAVGCALPVLKVAFICSE